MKSTWVAYVALLGPLAIYAVFAALARLGRSPRCFVHRYGRPYSEGGRRIEACERCPETREVAPARPVPAARLTQEAIDGTRATTASPAGTIEQLAQHQSLVDRAVERVERARAAAGREVRR